MNAAWRLGLCHRPCMFHNYFKSRMLCPSVGFDPSGRVPDEPLAVTTSPAGTDVGVRLDVDGGIVHSFAYV